VTVKRVYVARFLIYQTHTYMVTRVHTHTHTHTLTNDTFQYQESFHLSSV